jgi:Putative peptidoglycan binding domain
VAPSNFVGFLIGGILITITDIPTLMQATGHPPLYDYRYWAGMATAVQTELANRGYYHGSIDVAIGPGSREAIRAFQKANNLPVSGLIDPAC